MATAAATKKGWPVWLFVPNLIGYVRIVSALAGFPLAFSPAHWHLFFWLYGFSYALDALDGVAARALKQTSSFGAVLDMVTDRFCTAGLLAVLSRQFPSWDYVFLYLLILDIGSHWVQMYSSLASGNTSHKAIKDETPLLRFYYTAPYALFWICLFNELFLSCLFLLGHTSEMKAATPYLFFDVPGVTSHPVHLVELLAVVSFPVFALKQVLSIIQLAGAAARIVAVDEAARRARAQ